MKMKLIYDISVFGLAHYHERARTGVFRVVNNIAKGICCSRDLDIRFCSSQGNDQECLDFLDAHEDFTPYRETFINDLVSGIRGMIPRDTFWGGFSRRLTSRKLPRLIYHSPFFPIPQCIWNEAEIRKVVTVYDLIPIHFPQFFALGEDRLIRTLLDSITAETYVTCISESTKHDLCNYSGRVDPEKVVVTHLAASAVFYRCIDLSTIQSMRWKYNIPEGGRYILSVCTLEPRKNIEHAIRCFIKVVTEQNLNDLYLVLTGAKGWYFDAIFAEIDNSEQYKDRIILTGFVPDDDLAPLYSDALAFVYPSLYEGFGLPPLEAMQCGTPVITSNNSSLPEVVGDAGIMVDPMDGDSLCQAMLDLYRDDTLRDTLAQKALARASLFSWERCVRETIGIYRKAAYD